MNEKEKINREETNPTDKVKSDMRDDFISSATKLVVNIKSDCEAAIIMVEVGDGYDAIAYGDNDKIAGAILSLVEATPTIRNAMMKLKYIRMISDVFESSKENPKDGTH